MDRIPALHRHIKKIGAHQGVSGTILSFTVVRHPPAGFGTEPYTVALIAHDNGTKSMGQLMQESAPPTIGARVVPKMRRIRTMNNGLHINDFKYDVVVLKNEPLFTVTSYVLAVSGPSGVGKTTIARSLLSLFSSYAEQVPIITTRMPRKDESEPYTHITKNEFDKRVKNGEIISSTHMPSATEMRYYGYQRKDIEAIWKRGKLPIVVTELHLLKGLVETLGRRSILSCGLLPPGKSKRMMLSSLLHRLRIRGSHTEEQIQERLKVAESDLQAFTDHHHLFDHLLVNDEVHTCAQSIRELVAEVG